MHRRLRATASRRDGRQAVKELLKLGLAHLHHALVAHRLRPLKAPTVQPLVEDTQPRPIKEQRLKQRTPSVEEDIESQIPQ